MILLKKIYEYSLKKSNDIAIITSEKEITYKAFFDNICKCATILKKHNIKKGDILIFENTQDEYFCYIFFAINLLNCVSLPVDKNTPLNKIENIRKRVDAKLIVSIDEIKEKIDDVKKMEQFEFPNLDDTCLLLLSSGSTGKEKIIEYTNHTVYHVVKIYKKLYKLTEDNMILPTGPICRAYSITRLFIAFYYGLSLYIYDSLNIIDLISILNNYNNIILSTNPTILHYSLTLFYDDFASCLSNIKIIESCTAPLSTVDSRKILPILGKTKFYNFYGATELQMAYLDIEKYGYKKGCVGLPLEDVKIELLDDNNNVIKDGSNATGVVRISNSEYGYKYYKEKEQKYFYPGEIGYIENNLLYLVDRKKNFFNINGYKISPVDIEDVALLYDCVLECVCYYNSVLSLDIIVDKNFKINELKKVLNENLSSYQIPKKIKVVSRLHKTSNGKIDRNKYKYK